MTTKYTTEELREALDNSAFTNDALEQNLIRIKQDLVITKASLQESKGQVEAYKEVIRMLLSNDN